MKTLILSLMMTLFQVSYAGGSSVGSMSGSSVGNFLTVSWGSVGTMGGSQVGNFKSARIGFGNMDNSQVGTLSIAGGAEANGGSVGTMQLVGGAEANFGTGGGGVLVEYRAIKSGGHEI